MCQFDLSYDYSFQNEPLHGIVHKAQHEANPSIIRYLCSCQLKLFLFSRDRK